MVETKPPISVRLVLLTLAAAFAGLANNPLVRLEAQLGLSPSPLEQFLGIRGPFSGMTEATYRLVHLKPIEAMQANVLVIPTIAAMALCVMCWAAPQINTRRRERAFFAVAVGGTALNNLVPALSGFH